MQKNKGFTLIELLVVIAIIGILASVVLASLSSARTKGQDAKIVAQLSNMRAQAMFYSGAGTATFARGECPVATNSAAVNTVFDPSTTVNGISKFISDLGITVNVNTTLATDDTYTGTSCYSTGIPSEGGTWSVAVPLSSGVFCVDSTGWANKNSRAGSPYTVVTGTFAGAVVPAIDTTNNLCR